MTFPNEVGHVVHEPSDAIENRTTDAIASGAMEQGYIAFSVSRDEVGNDLKGWTIFVTAQDIYGQEHVGQRESVGGGGRHNLMTRVPGKIIARENI